MRKRILSALVAIGLVFGIGGYTLTHADAAPVASASVSHSGNITCAKNNSRELTVFDQTCPAGFFYVQIPASDIAGAVSGQPLSAAPSVNPIKIVHKQVTVNADYQAGTVAERTITFTGLPAYVSSGSAEVSGNNVGGLPDALTASIVVSPVAPGNGQTTRSFVVNVAGFTGTETYVLDVWVLVTT